MTQTTAAPLPVTRPEGCPFDPPAALGRLREETPVSRLAYPNGHQGWLVTSRELARVVLADPRFSARSELMQIPVPGGPVTDSFPPAMPGDLTGVDAPEHTRYRRLLTGQFTVRRMRVLADRIAEITAERLDVMEANGPGTDLVADFAHPIPAVMICELLGVPYADRERFQADAQAITSGLDISQETMGAAIASLQEYLAELVEVKRAKPADDLLSGLLDSDLTDVELQVIGGGLLAAGLDTTSNMLSTGTFAMLRERHLFDALRTNPDVVDDTVEELLRYLSVIAFTVRTPLEDVELGGQRIKAGEAITISLSAANRDPAQFAEPDRIDPRNPARGHLAFGHGAHQCLGQQLARVVLRVAFPALATRFPTLRLAIPADEVPFRQAVLIDGVEKLPVTWDVR